ncbi:MAG: hypothetical protein ACYDAL_18250 [Candidatus Dormibacteraceae bacterium]
MGKITTYVVLQPEGVLRVYAFMYSFLVASESEEDRLAADALALIEEQIAGNTATSGQDRTFEYREDGWQEVAFPRWWVSVTSSH